MEDNAQALQDLCRPPEAQEVCGAPEAQAEHIQGAPALAPSAMQPWDQGQALAEGRMNARGKEGGWITLNSPLSCR